MKVFIWGIGGKMGRSLYFVLTNNKTDEVIGGFDIFAKQEDFSVPIFSSVDEINLAPDVIIDFSRPEALDDILGYALSTKTNLVIATTGHSQEQIEKIKAASREIAIFMSSNMSLGVNLLINLAKQAARFLGTSYEVEIIEQHHNNKVDAPSGTAISIAKEINEVYEDKMSFCYGRHAGNEKRGNNVIGIHAIRGGTIVGKHDIMYIGTDEVVTLSHEAQSRQILAHGSVRAAQFIQDKQSGLYNMKDIVGKDRSVTNVTGLKGVTLITLNKITQTELMVFLDDMGNNKVNIDMVSEVLSHDETADISFTIEDGHSDIARRLLKDCSFKYSVYTGLAKLSIEGAGMEHQFGVTARVLKLLSTVNAKIWTITTSETKIACCVAVDVLADCIAVLKKDFGVN
ncbi:MAG: 4-hydroxy-tetrahydrodipicolinate reductase [Clostridia bacterium]|nr:4-hydroxy-tetrahydrodipicolinate reductase [Clostridia bacterium]